MDLDNKEILIPLLEQCRSGNQTALKRLHQILYNYVFSICLRYSQSEEDAQEIVNDGFMKIFSKLHLYNPELSFKGWVRRIMINTAIDHYRKNQKHQHIDLEQIDPGTVQSEILEKISGEEIIRLVQLLPPAYRMVFNLYIIEGFNHQEIANKLHISVGTSKSNLARAREKMKSLIRLYYQEEFKEYEG
ncbi:MAG: RNA polymerase sigma factor [Microscillaceae bacterium]|nr:RNA polymerase sigma factor [Microscillaceae bacterium]